MTGEGAIDRPLLSNKDRSPFPQPSNQSISFGLASVGGWPIGRLLEGIQGNYMLHLWFWRNFKFRSISIKANMKFIQEIHMAKNDRHITSC